VTQQHAGLLHVHEQYALRAGQAPPQVSTYGFVMRPWTQDELIRRLSAAGFYDIEIRPGPGRKTPDRLLVIATLPHSPAPGPRPGLQPADPPRKGQAGG
jgi:hypothetical protein